MKLADLLDRPIAFHRCLAEMTGSIDAALFLSQAIYWSKRTKDGWFYKTTADWHEETYLTRFQVDSARKKLKGIVEEKLQGLPAKLHYRVNFDVLRTRLLETDKLDSEKPTDLLLDIQQSTNGAEITTETTTKSKARRVRAKDQQADDAFLETLRPCYKHINFDAEIGKMKAWLLTDRAKKRNRTFTRRFVVTWLNNIEQPDGGTALEKREITKDNALR